MNLSQAKKIANLAQNILDCRKTSKCLIGLANQYGEVVNEAIKQIKDVEAGGTLPDGMTKVDFLNSASAVLDEVVAKRDEYTLAHVWCDDAVYPLVEAINKIQKDAGKKVLNKFTDDSMAMQISLKVFNSIVRQKDANAKTPNLQSWCEEADRMMRIDGRVFEEIIAVVEWVAQDAFWSQNILSTSKLRKQYTQLLAKAKYDIQKKQEQSLIL